MRYLKVKYSFFSRLIHFFMNSLFYIFKKDAIFLIFALKKLIDNLSFNSVIMCQIANVTIIQLVMK